MPTLFTATTGQTLTYLLGVCPFSIAFLVFVNSSISFVVTDLVGIHNGEGDVVGTLGFADELLALAACPIWGLLSDRIGVRYVSYHGQSVYSLTLGPAVAFVVLITVGLIGLHCWICYYCPRTDLVRAGKEYISSAASGKIVLQPWRRCGVNNGHSRITCGYTWDP